MTSPSSSRRSTLERAWNLVPVLRQPTFTAIDLVRSYDALLDLWFVDEEKRNDPRGGVDAEGRYDLVAETEASTSVATVASANSIDVCRNLQVICFLLLELSVLDPSQAAVVATSLERATRILQYLRMIGSGVESSEFTDSVLEDLRVESTSKSIHNDGCLRYRWSLSSASIGAVSIVMDRAALAAEADELWRMAHTPVPNEEDL
jgi:hypothetical protein